MFFRLTLSSYPIVAKVGDKIDDEKADKKQSFVRNILTSLDKELLLKLDQVQTQFNDMQTVQDKLNLLENFNYFS